MNEMPITRRKLLSYVAIIPVVGLASKLSFASEESDQLLSIATPRQTEGPFYPRSKPHDIDNDLARLGDSDTLAAGDLLTFKGRVLNREGHHVSGARVEIWHCNHLGKYHHVGARAPLDNNFQGYGETRSDSEGNYGFRTIKPGVYPGRACHIHFKVFAPGHRTLTSQMYLDNEMAGNLRDGIYQNLSDVERSAVTMKTHAVSANSSHREGMLDIVLA